ncbi:MAG: putative bifunctional diguanylate cyclase/phosphodiesterase [Nitriliruptoraceae bacterium]
MTATAAILDLPVLAPLPRTAASTGSPGSRRRVLVIDDDPIICLLATEALQHAGFEVATAGTAEEGARLLDDHGADLVLLDVLLPGGSGLQLCRSLRAEPATTELPVVVMTGLRDDDIIEEAFDAGATDFLRKPLEGPLLVHRLRFALRAAGTRLDLARRENLLADAQRLARLGTYEIDLVAHEQRWSAELPALLGLEETDPDADVRGFLGGVDPEERRELRRLRHGNLRGAGTAPVEELSYRCRRADGTSAWLHERVTLERDADGRPQVLRGIVQDLTDRRRDHEMIEYLERHDPVTGLLNRQGFVQAAEQVRSWSSERRGRLALAHLSFERLDELEAALGAQATEELLATLGARLHHAIQRYQERAAGSVPIVYGRWDSSSFALLVGRAPEAAEVRLLAEELLHHLTSTVELRGRAIVPTARIGIELSASADESVHELFRRAEHACRLPGVAPVRFHDPVLAAEADRRLSLEHDLRRTLDAGELELHYQPQYDADGRLRSFEALARWEHPQHGWVRPDVFIPIAESLGLTATLTDWVLDQGLAQLARWRREGFADLRLAVNVSASDVTPDLEERLVGALRRHRLPAGALEVELTESLLLESASAVEEVLARLRAQGIRLALDDFGTGYSSLSYLTRLPMDVLKIDRSFVRQLGEPRADAIVRAIVSLAIALELEVVAEGVETERQRAHLLGLGCTCLQGYLLAAPAPAAASAELLAAAVPSLAA